MELPPLGVDRELPLLKKNRLSTGIPDLDQIMEGGYLNPGNIMFLGPTGAEKAAFAYYFAASSNPKKETTIIINADSNPQSIEEKAASMGLDLKHVCFIDCYSQTLGTKKDQEPNERCTIVSGPGALNDISLAIKELIAKSAGKKIRMVFFSLSTFVLYNPKDSIIKFLKVIEGRLKNADGTTLYLVEEGVHDKQLLSLMEHGMDEKIILSEKAGKFHLGIPSVNLPIPLKIGPSGITII
jgi:KaiC/GvpD/RAD55 family RecA-like ATPase